MPLSGMSIQVSGCDALNRKKLELYRENFPDVQLFFNPCPHPDVLVVPAVDYEISPGSPEKIRFSTIPVIAYGGAVAMPAALAAGCRDYICTPWEPVELFERAFRCRNNSAINIGAFSLYWSRDGFLKICSEENVYSSEEPLTHRELQILNLMICNRGSCIGRKTLSELIGIEFCDGSRAPDMYVSRLRKKIAKLMAAAGIPKKLNPIKNSSGCGWGID